eukprot:COSAG04_NODE_18056_length_452_cov_0.764873_2_plen_29_part_01
MREEEVLHLDEVAALRRRGLRRRLSRGKP